MKKLLLSVLALTTFSSFAAKLEINVSNVKGGKALFYALIDDPKQFPDGKAVKADSVKLNGTQDTVVISIDGLKPGSYAISTFLDENGDGKLNKRLGIPSERFEFSNNPKLQFGPPSFNDCDIRIQDGVRNSTDIRVKYFKSHLGV